MSSIHVSAATAKLARDGVTVTPGKGQQRRNYMTEEILQNQAMPPEMAQATQVLPEMAPSEKMIPESELNKVTKKVRETYYQKGMEDAQKQLQNMGGIPQAGAQQVAQGALSEEQVRQMMRDEAAKINAQQAQMLEAQRIVGEFAGKMDLGKEAYEDFDDTVKQLDLRAIPEIVQLANSVGNTADIMYDLGKNPYKIANLKVLMQTSPHLARAEMNRLSQSITANKQAVSQVSTREPLSQMKPSTGSVDSGPMTLKDMKRQKWAKG